MRLLSWLKAKLFRSSPEVYYSPLDYIPPTTKYDPLAVDDGLCPRPHSDGFVPKPLTHQWKWESAGGVVLAGLSRDKIRNVYLIKPSNNYGPIAFPKGRVDANPITWSSLADTAKREVLEETGIKADFIWTGGEDLGRYEGSMSFTRYYLMLRVGGDTTKHDFETERVLELPIERAMILLKRIGNKRDLEVAGVALRYINALCKAMGY